ncbi:response regulator [Candidatus Bathyarchaeota archaeon]|nr:response regulator [Candidatus Bathyarchaeota archaeon]
MKNIVEQHVFFLDDDPAIREVVRRILEGSGIKVSCFSDPTTCMAKLRSQKCSLLITDLKMPEKSGIDVLKEVKRLTPWVPVLVISGYGDIPTVVRAIKAGAVDFIEKPFDKIGFIHKIRSMLPEIDSTDTYLGKPLTQAEISMLGLVIQGKSSKEIARLFHRSKRTIEDHRSHLMRKLKAQNLLDLAKRAAAMGLINMRAEPELARLTETL